MRIDPPAMPQPLAARAPARRARTATGFAMPQEEDALTDLPGAAPSDAAPEAAPSSGPAPAASTSCLAALGGGNQTPAGDAASADRAACRHGQALLGALASLQAASFAGPVTGPTTGPGGSPAPGAGGSQGSVRARQTLADLARALPPVSNPGLNGVLLAIAQRAAIELARSE